jgi:transketolase
MTPETKKSGEAAEPTPSTDHARDTGDAGTAATVARRREVEALHELAQQLRVDSIRCSSRAGSGHPTSSMSAADLMAVLLARHLRYDFTSPKAPHNDHLIFSKGHASPLLYSMFKAAGAISDEELLTFRTFGSRLEGHPTPAIPWVDVATGSLGQGLPIAVGIALAGKYMDKRSYHVWVLCGDSELAEGSIWEALDKAAYYHLTNMTAIFDVNRLGQRGETELGWNTLAYRQRVEAFGCRALVIDGHDLGEIDTALRTARAAGEPTAAQRAGRPTVIVARTIKGKGFSEVEDKDGWHGKALPPEMAERALQELGGVRHVRITVSTPGPGEPARAPTTGPRGATGAAVTGAAATGRAGVGTVEVRLPTYRRGEHVATRKAYGDALLALGVRGEVVAMDGEVSNSTYADEFAKAYPERFFEMFIAEQQLVATAVGMSVRGYVPFASTFAAFFSRAYDFIRMAAVSGADIRLAGSHCGVEIGQDGPSQMALEDLAAMRAVHGSTVLYPSDAPSTAKLVQVMADTRGIVYLRTTRGAYPVLYGSNERFRVGGSKVLRRSAGDAVALIGAGVTVHHCLEAAEALATRGLPARVIDLYSVKPLDVRVLREASRVTGGHLVVVEDHYPQGGLGAAVVEALSTEPAPPRVAHLAVRSLPTSGTPAELMAAAGITGPHIVNAAIRLVERAHERRPPSMGGPDRWRAGPDVAAPSSSRQVPGTAPGNRGQRLGDRTARSGEARLSGTAAEQAAEQARERRRDEAHAEAIADARRRAEPDRVTRQSDGSFPASDPPSWSSRRG